MSSRVYALANQKGGVGKTTTAINMAACVAEAGTPVLLIDLDPQANATTGLGFRPDELEASTYDLLHGRPLDSVIIETAVPNLFRAPSHPDLAAAQVEIPGGADHGTLLRDLLAGTEEPVPVRVRRLPAVARPPDRERARSRRRLIGQVAPPLQVSAWVNGDPIAAEELRGKVVLIDFWAVWPNREGGNWTLPPNPT